MERNTDVQYDDDLTVGTDDYDESLYDGDIDLFEFVGEEESAITRLKTIVLSIEWEITDGILRELNEELRELREIWSQERINLVYIQALDKLSKYIFQERADANPNAIKLLLTFYTNLEKIVLEEDISEDDKKRILMEDVERFEKFKKIIGRSEKTSEEIQPATDSADQQTLTATEQPSQEQSDIFEDREDILLNLKAIVYGMDWEITGKDLEKLDNEVEILKKNFSSSKVKLLFLQGLGTLGNYINVKRSDAHADAFQLLHTFFAGLEKVVKESLSYEDEKAFLLQEVGKFNKFKEIISPTIASGELAATPKKDEGAPGEVLLEEGEFTPALSDVDGAEPPSLQEPFVPDDSVKTSAVEEVVEDEGDIDLVSEMASTLDSFFGDDFDELGTDEMSEDLALQGVAVETEADDESDEEALPRHGDMLAPALSEDEDDYSPGGQEPEVIAGQDEDSGRQVDQLFSDDTLKDEIGDSEYQGESLAEDQEISPALVSLDDEAGLNERELAEGPDSAIEDRLENFFGDEEIDPALTDEQEKTDEVSSSGVSSDEPSPEITERLDGFFEDAQAASVSDDAEFALQGVDVETEADDDSGEEQLAFEDGELAPALGGGVTEAEQPATTDFGVTAEPSDEVQDRLEGFFEEPSASPASDMGEEALQGIDVETEADDDSDEEPLPFEDGEVAPALGAGDIDSEQPVTEDLSVAIEPSDEVQDRIEGFFDETPITPVSDVGEVALQGVDVETEADDESDEEPLVFQDGEVAPALGDDEIVPDHQLVDEVPVAADQSEEIKDRLEDFFVEGDESHLSEDTDLALQGVEVETEADDESDEEPLPLEKGEIAPALQAEDSGMGDVGEFDNAPIDDGYALVDFDEETTEDQTLLGKAVTSSDEEDFRIDEPVSSDDDDIIPEFLDTPDVEESELSDTTSSKEVSEPDKIVFEELVDEPEVIFEAVEEDVDLYEHVEQLSLEEPEDELMGNADTQGEDDFLASLEATEPDEEVIFTPVDEGSALGATLEDYLDIDAEERKDEDLEKILDDEIIETDFVPEEIQEKDLLEDFDLNQNEQILEAELAQPLSSLRDSVVAAKRKVDDTVLQSLTEGIDRLTSQCANQPLEKTFLQLMTPMVGHLERNRELGDTEPIDLLFSVLEKLELAALGNAEQSQIQEALLKETSNVLLWQQKVIRSLTSETFEESDLLGEPLTDAMHVDDDSQLGLPGIAGAIGKDSEREELKGEIADIVSQELEAVKVVFKDELSELRRELLRDLRKPDA